MSTFKIDLTEETTDKLSHITASVQHWAQKHTALSIQAAEALDQIRALTEARNKVISDAIEASDADSSKVLSVSLNPEEKVLNLDLRD